MRSYVLAIVLPKYVVLNVLDAMSSSCQRILVIALFSSIKRSMNHRLPYRVLSVKPSANRLVRSKPV